MNDGNGENKISHSEMLKMTTEVVAAYLECNEMPSSEIDKVIKSVYQSLSNIEVAQPEPVAETPKPAVSIKKSIQPDYLICLEDGKKLKMLKRHLRTMYKLTPDEYRTKWNLPSDYPMVAENYAKQRSAFAKQIGLGKHAKQAKPRARARAAS